MLCLPHFFQMFFLYIVLWMQVYWLKLRVLRLSCTKGALRASDMNRRNTPATIATAATIRFIFASYSKSTQKSAHFLQYFSYFELILLSMTELIELQQTTAFIVLVRYVGVRACPHKPVYRHILFT